MEAVSDLLRFGHFLVLRAHFDMTPGIVEEHFKIRVSEVS